MENEVKKSDSPRWNSKVSLDSSEWLAENVKGVDQSVEEMLLLVENDGCFALDNGDNNHSKQSELIARIKEISHRHHSLADHYNKLTGDFNSYVQSANETKTYERTQLSLPLLTPEKKLGMHNVEGSEFSLSSGGGISDTTPKEGSESSSLSSDSDSESCNSSPNDRSTSGETLKHVINMETEFSEQEHTYGTIQVAEYEMLLRRISEYENELKVSNQKFQFAEEEIAKLKSELQNNEAAIVKMGSLEAELVSAKNQIKLHEDETDKENKRSLMLQRQIIELESDLESKKEQIWDLQENVMKYKTEVTNRDHEIRRLNGDFHDASGNFALEKWQLESRVSELTKCLTSNEARTKELEMESELLTNKIKKCETEKTEMEKKQEDLKMSWQDETERLKAEICQKNSLLDTLNENLDGLKLKYDMLMAEKDGVNAKLQTLNADLSDRDNQIQLLEKNVRELHFENNTANKLTADLRSRIDELENEVGVQRVVISDRDEEKREAIRQLCFSLDHFRSSYEELREAYGIRKRPTAVVS